MIQIPLRYSHQVIGQAQIDDDCEPLRHLGYYSVSLPRTLRAVAAGRPDIILATLKEDALVRAKCSPFVSVYGTQIMLVHLVLRNSLARTVLQASLTCPTEEQFCVTRRFDEVRSDINEARSAIGRIAYVSGDRTDCRRENLREL